MVESRTQHRPEERTRQIDPKVLPVRGQQGWSELTRGIDGCAAVRAEKRDDQGEVQADRIREPVAPSGICEKCADDENHDDHRGRLGEDDIGGAPRRARPDGSVGDRRTGDGAPPHGAGQRRTGDGTGELGQHIGHDALAGKRVHQPKGGSDARIHVPTAPAPRRRQDQGRQHGTAHKTAHVFRGVHGRRVQRGCREIQPAQEGDHGEKQGCGKEEFIEGAAIRYGLRGSMSTHRYSVPSTG